MNKHEKKLQEIDIVYREKRSKMLDALHAVENENRLAVLEETDAYHKRNENLRATRASAMERMLSLTRGTEERDNAMIAMRKAEDAIGEEKARHVAAMAYIAASNRERLNDAHADLRNLEDEYVKAKARVNAAYAEELEENRHCGAQMWLYRDYDSTLLLCSHNPDAIDVTEHTSLKVDEKLLPCNLSRGCSMKIYLKSHKYFSKDEQE